TLPPDMIQIRELGFLANPLTAVVLPNTLETVLADTIAQLQDQGILVFTYPLAPQIVRPRPLLGAFQFGILGPPGNYSVLASTNLSTWMELDVVSNPLGAINFTDETSHNPQRFYRVARVADP